MNQVTIDDVGYFIAIVSTLNPEDYSSETDAEVFKAIHKAKSMVSRVGSGIKVDPYEVVP